MALTVAKVRVSNFVCFMVFRRLITLIVEKIKADLIHKAKLTKSFHKLKDSQRAELEEGRRRFEEQLARGALEDEQSTQSVRTQHLEHEEEDNSANADDGLVNGDRLQQINQQQAQDLEKYDNWDNENNVDNKRRKGMPRSDSEQVPNNHAVDEDVRMGSPDRAHSSGDRKFQNTSDHNRNFNNHGKKARPSRYVKEQNEYERVKAEREAHAAALREREQAAKRREREREQWRTAVNAKTRTGQVKLGKQSRLLLDKVKRQMAET